jgi:hypothetical protein
MMTFRRVVLIAVLVFDVLLVAVLWRPLVGPPTRLTDRAGLIPRSEVRNYNQYLDWLRRESGVDLRTLIVRETGDRSLEEFSVGAMRDLGVGRETGGRGMLIVYDAGKQAMRVEVGPKLEGILPDAFVGYLMREHVKAFFGAGRPELGLRTTLFMIHWRIRMARLGEEYDPSFEEFVRDVRRLASGGGASGRIPLDTKLAGFINTSGDSAARAYFRPQPTVEEAYRRDLEWLALGGGQTDVPLFTPASQAFLRDRLPLSPAFNEYLLATEYGRAYEVDERGDLALLYYTDDPFLSPKFFRRTADGWQLDIRAEVANSQEAVGGWYTWKLRISGDDFSRVFADRYLLMDVNLDDFYRVAGGDNRWLTIRGDEESVESELDPHSLGTVHPGPDAEGVEYLTVFQAAERVRQSRGRPVLVLLYGTWNEQTRGQFPEIVRAAEYCGSRGVTFLGLHTDMGSRAMTELPGFLARHRAPFPPVQLYRWRSGLLSSNMGGLGISVGRSWAPPLVAVLDRDGTVVWQSQGVTDWAGVQDRCDF